MTAATVVCCSITSDSQTRYGSAGGAPGGARHGRVRAWASYHASSAAWKASTSTGMGRLWHGLRVPETVTPESRSRRARSVGETVARVGGAAFRRFGFNQAAILSHWTEIVGPDYARHSMPEGLSFPVGKRSGGTLKVLVTGAFAPMLRHVEPQVIERANRFFGYAAVSRLALRHGDVPLPRAERPAQAPAPLADATRSTLRDIADPDLRASLESLAQAVASTRGPPRIS